MLRYLFVGCFIAPQVSLRRGMRNAAARAEAESDARSGVSGGASDSGSGVENFAGSGGKRVLRGGWREVGDDGSDMSEHAVRQSLSTTGRVLLEEADRREAEEANRPDPFVFEEGEDEAAGRGGDGRRRSTRERAAAAEERRRRRVAREVREQPWAIPDLRRAEAGSSGDEYDGSSSDGGLPGAGQGPGGVSGPRARGAGGGAAAPASMGPVDRLVFLRRQQIHQQRQPQGPPPHQQQQRPGSAPTSHATRTAATAEATAAAAMAAAVGLVSRRIGNYAPGDGDDDGRGRGHAAGVLGPPLRPLSGLQGGRRGRQPGSHEVHTPAPPDPLRTADLEAVRKVRVEGRVRVTRGYIGGLLSSILKLNEEALASECEPLLRGHLGRPPLPRCKLAPRAHTCTCPLRFLTHMCGRTYAIT